MPLAPRSVADSIVLHGGLGFQVVPNDANVLVPLSQGCYYIERLAYVVCLLCHAWQTHETTF